MLTDFQNFFTVRLNSSKGRPIIKYPTTPETRRYTTLWNIKRSETTWSIYCDLRYLGLFRRVL